MQLCLLTQIGSKACSPSRSDYVRIEEKCSVYNGKMYRLTFTSPRWLEDLHIGPASSYPALFQLDT